MSTPLICPQGHIWETEQPATSGTASCPMCGRAGAPTVEPETLAPAAPPPDGETVTHAGDPRGADVRSAAVEALDRFAVPGHELLSVLGRGGMGVVYQARHLQLNRVVALKMILAGSHAGEAERARFRTEAEAVARLQHPNIVQIHEIGEHDGLPFFSLEFCGGGNLAKRIQGTPFPPAQAARMVQTLAAAMDAAHGQSVLHRDLKPANVLLTDAGVPKITDFGLAKKLDDAGQTHSGAVMGTPSYMPPEQAAGDVKNVGPAADVYSLGAILYELLTGRPPFKAATSLDTLLQVVHDDPVPPRQLQSRTPRDLETICLKCLQKDPARRYARAVELAEDLGRFLAGEPIKARPLGAFGRTWRWCKRKPALAGLVTAMTLLIVALVAGAFWYQQERARQDQDELVRQNEAERQRLLAEQGISQALDHARKTRGDLRTRLRKEGVQALLNQEVRWTEALKDTRSELTLARNLAERAASLLDPQWLAQIEELERGLAHDEADHRFAVRLEKIRLQRSLFIVGGKLDDPHAEQEYLKAFEEAGISMADDRLQETAALIKQSAINSQIAIALLDWTILIHSKDPDRSRRLMTMASVDSSKTDQAALKEGAFGHLSDKAEKEPEFLSRMSPHMVVMLSAFVPPAQREMWYRRGQEAHPGDFWINYFLADILRAARRPVEAAGYYRVALVIRPNTAAVYHQLGLCLYDQKNLPAAIDHYKKALNLDAQLAGAWNDLGLALYDQGNLPEAIEKYQKAVDIEPKYANAWTNLGLAFYDQKKLPEAIDCYQKALDSDGKHARAWNLLGLARYDQKKPSEAIDCYQTALNIDPKYAGAWNHLGTVLRDQKKLAAAVDAYQKAVTIDPGYALAWGNLGVVLYEQKQLSAAVDAYRKAVDRDARMAWVWYNLGLAYYQQRDLPKAGAAYNKALAIDPKYAAAWGNLGNVLREQKHTAAAIDAYRKALHLDAKSVLAWNGLGIALSDQNDFAAASAAINKARESDPTNAVPWNSLGVLHRKQRDLPGAVRFFKKAVEFDPKYLLAWRNLGNTLRDQNDLIGAVDEFKKALEVDPNSVDTWIDLGIVLHRQRNVPGAADAFRKAATIDPRSKWAWNNLGNALLDQHDMTGATEAFEKALEIDPKLPNAWNGLGNVLSEQKRYVAAVTAYKKALAADPTYAFAWRGLGYVHRGQNDLPAALAAFKQAIAIDPEYPGAWNGLGNVLRDQKNLAAAAVAFKKAVTLDPEYAIAWENLGMTEYDRKQLADAVAAFQSAIKLRPKYAYLHGRLGQAHRDRGDFAEAVASSRQALALLPGGDSQRSFAEWQLKQCQDLLALEQRLLGALAGDKVSADDYLALADLCRRYQQRYRDAATLFARAFSLEPKHAEDLPKTHRYDAACYAVRAAHGDGVGAAALDAMEKTRLRKQALDWLQSDLAARVTASRSGAGAAMALRDTMQHWQRDTDLVSVRGADELAGLAPDERKDWQKLWSDVNQALKDAAKLFDNTQLGGTLTAQEKSRIHDVKLTAGATYVLEMESVEFDTFLKLQDPGGKQIAANNDIVPGVNRNSRIFYAPKEDGTFRLVATSFREAGIGAYTLHVRQFRKDPRP